MKIKPYSEFTRIELEFSIREAYSALVKMQENPAAMPWAIACLRKNIIQMESYL